VIDWLRKGAADPTVTVAGRSLPIAIRRLPRASRLTMRLAPDGSEVRISMPRWGRTRDAVDFAASRSAWLETQLARLPVAKPPTANDTLLYRGQALRIGWDPALPRVPQLDGAAIQLGGPAETLAPRLRRWLEAEALRLISEDLDHYCTRAGVARPDLRLSRAQRRWGSCSGTGCIRINWRLIQADDMVRRSVVAHEVAHLVHFDHSPAFHRFLRDLFDGDLALADAWLRREGRSLYAAFG